MTIHLVIPTMLLLVPVLLYLLWLICSSDHWDDEDDDPNVRDIDLRH